MKFRQIEAFRNVMVTGSVTQAADMMAISQPAVSHLITSLEEWLGFTLFERRPGQPLQPTEDAEALYAEVQKSYVGMEQLMKAGREIRGLRKGLLRVVGPPFVANSILCDATAAFALEYPDVSLTLEARPHEEMLVLLAGRQQDVGVGVLPVGHPALQVTPLGAYPLLCAVPAAHPLAQAPGLAPADLAGQPVITNAYGSQLETIVERMLEDGGVAVQRRVSVRNQEIACSLVASGVGLAFIARPLARHIAGYPGIVFKELRPAASIELGVITSGMRPPSRMVRIFMEHVARAATRY